MEGDISAKREGFAVLLVHGVGFKVFASKSTLSSLSEGRVNFFTHLHVREDILDLYGFLSPGELEFFEKLIGVSGVGPKSALAVMDVAELSKLSAAIQEGRPDLLTQAAGIGRKTAERIVVELRGKIASVGSESIVKTMESDTDLLETLVSLGYRKETARAALDKIGGEVKGLEGRLKAALGVLGKK